jgi:hypothetical protein
VFVLIWAIVATLAGGTDGGGADGRGCAEGGGATVRVTVVTAATEETVTPSAIEAADVSDAYEVRTVLTELATVALVVPISAITTTEPAEAVMEMSAAGTLSAVARFVLKRLASKLARSPATVKVVETNVASTEPGGRDGGGDVHTAGPDTPCQAGSFALAHGTYCSATGCGHSLYEKPCFR